jgi:4-carboxymuconolactone decarboxylase
MSRLPLASADGDPILEELVSKIQARGIDVPNLYLTIGNAPMMLQAWMGFTWPLRHDATSPRGLRELVIMRVAQSTRCAYMWAHHWLMAVDGGLSSAQLELLADWRNSDVFSDLQKSVLRYTDEVIGGHGVEEATFRALQEAFSAREIIELTLAATFYLNLSRFALALDIDIEPKFVEYSRLLRA